MDAIARDILLRLKQLATSHCITTACCNTSVSQIRQNHALRTCQVQLTNSIRPGRGRLLERRTQLTFEAIYAAVSPYHRAIQRN